MGKRNRDTVTENLSTDNCNDITVVNDTVPSNESCPTDDTICVEESADNTAVVAEDCTVCDDNDDKASDLVVRDSDERNDKDCTLECPYCSKCRHNKNRSNGKKSARGKKPLGKGMQALIVISCIVVVLTVFLSVFMNDKSLGVGQGDTSGKYGTVLADIEGITIANPRFIDLAMLGAHDAPTAYLEPDSEVDYYDQQTFLGKVEPITRGLQYRFGKTQMVGLGQQLLQGTRFFHIKCTDYEGTWYATHAHLCGTLETHILEVLEYLDSDEAKGEIVCLLFQPMYFGEGATYGSLHDWLATVTYNGKSIYDYVYYDDVNIYNSPLARGVNIGELRYNDLTNNGNSAGVVLFDRREEGDYLPEYEGSSPLTAKYFDMDNCTNHKWHSRMGQKNLLKEVEQRAIEIESNWQSYSDILRMNQTQGAFAAGFTDIFNCIGVWSLVNFAETYNLTLLEHKDFDKWLTAMPVFQVDFVNSNKGDFNNRVNQKIIAHNTETVAKLLALNN